LRVSWEGERKDPLRRFSSGWGGGKEKRDSKVAFLGKEVRKGVLLRGNQGKPQEFRGCSFRGKKERGACWKEKQKRVPLGKKEKGGKRGRSWSSQDQKGRARVSQTKRTSGQKPLPKDFPSKKKEQEEWGEFQVGYFLTRVKGFTAPFGKKECGVRMKERKCQVFIFC